jgi:hypothetical protein
MRKKMMLTYLFPVYLTTSIRVSLPRSFETRQVTLCFVGSARTGHILTYSSSFGYPGVDLYERALLALRAQESGKCSWPSTVIPMARQFSGVMPVDPGFSTRHPDPDRLCASLNWRYKRKLSLIDEQMFRNRLLRCFFDWGRDELALINDPYSISLEALYRILSATVMRMSEL